MVNTLPSRDRDIAMVFQSYALYPHMSVADNIAYGLKLRRMDKAEIEKRVKRAADMLELGPLLDRKPKQLSGGQRQRVAMGRAIVREPQVFLMDEPLSNLDAKLRVQMRAEIAQVQRDLEVTTIYVTHDQTEAMTMGDRVALMKAGVLQQLGAPQHLYDHPDNIFVAGFIGSPPMNMAIGTGRPHRRRRHRDLRRGRPSRCRTRSPPTRPALASYAGATSRSASAARTWRTPPWPATPAARRGSPRRSALTEALGSEIVVHFPVDAPKVVTEDTKALEKDAGTDDVPVAHVGNIWVASFSPRSRVRPGDQVEIAIDQERLHFFDPETGLAIRD